MRDFIMDKYVRKTWVPKGLPPPQLQKGTPPVAPVQVAASPSPVAAIGVDGATKEEDKPKKKLVKKKVVKKKKVSESKQQATNAVSDSVKSPLSAPPIMTSTHSEVKYYSPFGEDEEDAEEDVEYDSSGEEDHFGKHQQSPAKPALVVDTKTDKPKPASTTTTTNKTTTPSPTNPPQKSPATPQQKRDSIMSLFGDGNPSTNAAPNASMSTVKFYTPSM